MGTGEGRKARVVVFAASTREGSYNRKLAQEMAAALERHGLEVTLAELRDYELPFYNGDSEQTVGLPDAARAFKRLLAAHDAMAIVTPEYNGGFPGLLKNVIDWSSRREPGETTMIAFAGKKAAILAASPGARGGVRALKALRELLEALHVETVPSQVALAKATEAFDAEGHLARVEDRDSVHRLAGELARALREQPVAQA